MEIATLRETANFSNKTNAVSPYTLGQVLASFATQVYVTDAIAHAVIDPSQIDLSAYAKKTDLPTKLSQLFNDDNYVQTISGKIPSEFLPAYVDDVLEVNTYSALPRPGESGKIYVTLDTNLTYRWAGSDYTEISKSLALGETEYTAYRGDRGKTAYEHSQATGNPHGLSLSDLGILITAAEINYISGLNINIMTALDNKLSLSGGTLTGPLILKGAPTTALEAATKDYVDTAINGISVTVTQNVTKINEISEDVDGLTQTVGTQADTITEVQNDISGLNQTTTDHTEYITQLQTRAGTMETTIREQHESITTLEQTVDIFDIKVSNNNYIIPVLDDGHLEDHTSSVATTETLMEYDTTYAGESVIPATATISIDTPLTDVAFAITKTALNDRKITMTYTPSTFELSSEKTLTVTCTYVIGGVTYTKVLHIKLIPIHHGKDGETGISVTAVTEWYYLSDSRTSTTGGTWVTTAPSSQDGKYIWTKTVITFSNSTSTETSPICVTGDAGVIGHDGTAITGVDVLYYQSDSATTLIGGSWSTTAPAWINGKFLWSKSRIYYVDYTGTTWSEDSEPACVTGQKGEDATIISDTEPTDTTKMWLNLNDGFTYYYDNDPQSTTYQTWIITNDMSDTVKDINDRITENDSNAQRYVSEAQTDLLKTVYTKTEVDTKIEQSAGTITENYTREITTATANGDEAFDTVTQLLEANIKRGQDPLTGKPYIELNTGDASGFSLRIANDKISIFQGSTEVSGWSSDKFDVATVITSSLGLGDFEFVIKPGAVGSRGLSFKHRE